MNGVADSVDGASGESKYLFQPRWRREVAAGTEAVAFAGVSRFPPLRRTILRSPAVIAAVASCVCLAILAACSDRADGTTSSATSARPGQTLRIASLSPAVSRTLADVGLLGAIVGRTPFCTSVPTSVPVVGSLLDVDVERLVGTHPTHLLVQPAAGGIDPMLTSLAAERGWTLGQWRLGQLSDVERMLTELPALLGSGNASGANGVDALATTCQERRAAIAVLRARMPAANAPRVLLLVSVDPMSAAGHDTFLHEALEGCGYRNAVLGSAYPEVSHEDVMRLAPDAIIVLRERMPDAADAERMIGRVLADEPLQRRDGRRIAFFADADAMLPSSAVAAMAGRLKTLLDALTAPCAAEAAQ